MPIGIQGFADTGRKHVDAPAAGGLLVHRFTTLIGI
jgi:hypothetical protein